MRWITFFILLFVAAALQQSRLGSIPHPHSSVAWPSVEYLPVLGVFYALYASENAAPICGLLCGVLYDLGNGEMIGTSAVPLAITAWMIVRVRLSIFREHFMAQLLITLLAIVIFGVLAILMRLLTHAPLEGHSVSVHFGVLMGNAVYSAVIAPGFYWVFFRFPGLLGFTSHGARTRGK